MTFIIDSEAGAHVPLNPLGQAERIDGQGKYAHDRRRSFTENLCERSIAGCGLCRLREQQCDCKQWPTATSSLAYLPGHTAIRCPHHGLCRRLDNHCLGISSNSASTVDSTPARTAGSGEILKSGE